MVRNTQNGLNHMSNEKLRNFLQEYLGSLGQNPTGRRWTIRELVKETGVSRSTLYNWLDGTSPASPASIQQFALGLAELKCKMLDRPDAVDELLPDLLSQLQAVMGQADARAPRGPELGFVPYAPICDLPPGTKDPENGEVADWTFLGAVLGLLQSARESDPGGYRVSVGAFEGFEADVLAGFFSNPKRAENWRFLRTPIQVPLNGLVLWRDVSTFVRNVYPRLRKSDAGEVTAEKYFHDLQQALWRPSSRGAEMGRIKGDVFPLSVCNEAGRDYATSILGFEEVSIAKRSQELDSDVDPRRLQQWLMESSDRFQRAVEAGEASLSGPRLPVLLLDELTCLRVLAASSDGWRNTEPVLLSSPHDDVMSEAPLRPRFSVSIAVRKAKSKTADEFDATSAALEELLWSNTSIIAGYYAGLFHELRDLVSSVQAKSKALGPRPLAGLYVLRWLSLDLSQSECEALVKDQPHRSEPGRAWSSPAVNDCAAWADIIAGAKAILLADPSVRKMLKCELETLLEQDGRVAASKL